MGPEDRSYGSLFKTLNENIRYPFLVLDKNNTILSFNNEASSFFSFHGEKKKISEVFDENSSEKIKNLVKELLSKNSPVSGTGNYKLKSGKQFNSQVLLTSYNEENDSFIFCSFKVEEEKINTKGVTNIKTSGSIKGIIKNKEIEDVIGEIKSNYPFTFLGKEKIRRKVNKFDELFWIKDNESNFILVNNSLAEKFGLNISQLEGKNESAFVPAFMLNFYEAIERYIRESANCIMIEGVPLKGISGIENLQTVEVPLSDADNKIIAIVGFTQKVENKNDLPKEEIIKNFIEKLNLPFAFIGYDFKIKYSGRKIAKIFLRKNSEIINKNFKEIFPEELSNKIEGFINSSLKNEELKLKLKDYSNLLNIKLQKLDNDEKEKGISLIIEENNLEGDDNTSLRKDMINSVIQNIPEPVFIYDRENLGFLNVNNAALSLYGFSREEFLQMDLTDLYAPEDIQTLLDNSNPSVREGEFSGPYRQKKKDGSQILIEMSKVKIEYEDKEAVYNVIRDVTEKEELIKSNQLFKAAFDNTSDLVFVTDSSGFISYINDLVPEVLKIEKGKIINSSFASLVKDEQRGKINSQIFQTNLKENLTLKADLKTNGNFIAVELSIAPVFNYKNEVTSYTILGKIKEEKKINISEEKKINVEKESTPKIIEQEFLSSMFHEILTPINVILGFAQEITDSVENLTPEQKESASIIKQNRIKLLNTMNSVVEYSALVSSKNILETEQTRITEIIDNVQADFENISSENEVDLLYGKISSSLKFETEKQKFQNLVLVLARIIIKLSEENKIYFSAYQLDEENFVISFKDNYSSISKNLLNDLIKLFNEEVPAKNYGVSKLNLAYAKKLLSLLNGRFELIKKDNEVEDYQFVFPIKISETIKQTADPILEEKKEEIPDVKEEKKNQSKQEERMIVDKSIKKIPDSELSKSEFDIRGLTCLYIEDQVDTQLLFKTQMKDLRDLQFAIDFEEALPILSKNRFDFIVMDINLPGDYNGLDALKIVRRLPGYENIPIIAVSAYLLPGDKSKFIAAGFTDFIAKPIFREKMIQSLEKIFSLSIEV